MAVFTVFCNRLSSSAIRRHVVGKIDGAEIADSDLVAAGVQRDLGAKIRGVNYAGMLLRRTQVARILEGDPRMAGFKDHGEHFAPKIDRTDCPRIACNSPRCAFAS